MIGLMEKSGALPDTLAFSADLESQLDVQIDRLERLFGRSNPMMRDLVKTLSVVEGRTAH